VCWAGTGRAVLSPAPLSWLAAAYLRCASDRFLLTNANTSCTIKLPASLRSENCSPSARNAVRVPFGISVRLRRNPHSILRTLDRSTGWAIHYIPEGRWRKRIISCRSIKQARYTTTTPACLICRRILLSAVGRPTAELHVIATIARLGATNSFARIRTVSSKHNLHICKPKPSTSVCRVLSPPQYATHRCTASRGCLMLRQV